jgi:hypothetical protein
METLDINEVVNMDIEHRRERHRVNKANAKQRAREFVDSYLATHPCVDCGESDVIVLTFDHVRGEKRANVADMISSGLSVETIAAEIAKCEVTCFNCHAIRSQKRSGMYRWQRLNGGG